MRTGKRCGVFTHIGDGDNARGGHRVNLGCVEALDALALDLRIIDGRSLPVMNEPGQTAAGNRP